MRKTWQYLMCYALSCKRPFSIKAASEHLEISMDTTRRNIDFLIDEGKIIKSQLKVKRSPNAGNSSCFVYWSSLSAGDVFIDSKVGTNKKRALDLLKGGKGFSVVIMAKELGMKDQASRWVLDSLYHSGLINKHSNKDLYVYRNSVIRGAIYYIGLQEPESIFGDNKISTNSVEKQDLALIERVGINKTFAKASQGLAL